MNNSTNLMNPEPDVIEIKSIFVRWLFKISIVLILVLDESFSALDNHTREEMHDILFNLCEEIHNCVVIITHDIDEAIYLGQNIIVLNNNPGTVTEKVNNPFFKKTNSDLMRDDEYLKFRDYLLGCIG